LVLPVADNSCLVRHLVLSEKDEMNVRVFQLKSKVVEMRNIWHAKAQTKQGNALLGTHWSPVDHDACTEDVHL